MAQELHWKAPILVAEGRNRCWHVATCPPPSVRLWLSPADRRQLTKVRERIADITRHSASHSALLRARITTLELSADHRLYRPAETARDQEAVRIGPLVVVKEDARMLR
jgi:hypothetical protein